MIRAHRLVPHQQRLPLHLINTRFADWRQSLPLATPSYPPPNPTPPKRVAVVPAELQRILNEDPLLRRWFDQLSYRASASVMRYQR